MARTCVNLWCLLAATCVGAQDAPPPERAAADFFEQRVRPLLVEHCQECHGARKQEAGLRLDSGAAVRKGGDSGPVLIAGDVQHSPLLEAVRYTGDVKMPPKGKLPPAAIEALTAWIARGAVWPESADAPAKPGPPSPQDAARTHWAFQPVRDPPVPQVAAAEWGASPIDAFLWRELAAAGLRPSPRATRRTLIRRATFDLHGLPPTPGDVAAFEADDSPQAFARLVDRLLDSPRYGERWGRHWLDVARYSDTKGYVRLADNPKYPSAWTYRDYVIRAFNADVPYDRFVLEQLAADQLDLGDDPRPLAALGFLTLGQRFINSQHDIIDDRIDVVCRGLLGLTVGCARCHDHKFDPVPMADYYSLHGVFASSLEPHVPPLILPPAARPQYAAYLQELAQRTGKLQEFLETQRVKLETSFRERAAEYLLAGDREPVQANFLAVMFLIDASKDLNPVMTQRWARYLDKSRKRHDPIFAPWYALARLAATAGETFGESAAALVAQWRAAGEAARPLNAVVVAALAEPPLRDLPDAARRYAALLQQADERWRRLRQSDPEATQLADPDWEALRRLLYGADALLAVAPTDVEEFLYVDATTQNQWHQQQRQVEDWIATPGAAPHAHVLMDAPAPVEPRIFLRGNASNPGETVPRQFLAVLSPPDRRPFQQGSGRLELARAIVDRRNPLTARVLVNRVWQQHFGAGLVRTPSDFGLRGEPPTHPELLDYLASRFLDDGWSIKRLQRRIMLSAAYQQQSLDRPDAQSRDPENRLVWKMNRRRLDWEALHDALVSAAGRLDLTMGGPAVDLLSPPFAPRRAVYGLIDRQHLPAVLRTFDFPAPDASSPQRHQTTVPQQALYFLNSPFLKEQVRGLAAAPEIAGVEPVERRIDAVYQRLFGRPAESAEIALAVRYLQSAPAAEREDDRAQRLSPWEELLQALLLSNEFLFVD